VLVTEPHSNDDMVGKKKEKYIFFFPFSFGALGKNGV
jgi:hypothetical protein